MTTDVIPTTGLEYVLTPDGTLPLGSFPGSQTPYSWTSTDISYNSCVPLTGFRVNTRYRVVVEEPPVPPALTPTYDITYPNWTLVSQTLTCTSHPANNPGNPLQQLNPFIIPTPGQYGPYENPSVSGIVDGSCYDYFSVFDQSQSGYIEALSSYDSEPIENTYIPTTPYDESVTPPLYPIDALTKFIPDTRESVTATYQLTTVYNTGLSDITDTINIIHIVTQSTTDWSAQVRTLVDRTYYGNGIFPSKPDNRVPPQPSPGTNADGSHYYP